MLEQWENHITCKGVCRDILDNMIIILYDYTPCLDMHSIVHSDNFNNMFFKLMYRTTTIH